MIVGFGVQSPLFVVERIDSIGYGRIVFIPLVCAEYVSAVVVLVVDSQYISPSLLNDSGRIAHLHSRRVAATAEFGVMEYDSEGIVPRGDVVGHGQGEEMFFVVQSQYFRLEGIFLSRRDACIRGCEHCLSGMDVAVA